MAHKHGLLNQLKATAEAALRDRVDEQESTKKKLREQPPSHLDLSELKAVISAARKAGDLEQRLTKSRKSAIEDKTSCESELSRLGKFRGTIEALSQTAMPVSETMDIYESRLDELSEQFRDYTRRTQELGAEKKQSDHELKALLSTTDIPTISELQESRRVRNAGWQLVKKKYIERSDVEEDIEKYAPESDLPTRYEYHIDIVDHISDKLRLEADVVAKRVDLEEKIESLTLRLSDFIQGTSKVKTAIEVQKEKWIAVWKPLGIDPGTPREMKQWLLRVERLLASIRSAETVSGDAQKLDDECTRLKDTLSSQVAKFDETIDVQELSLDAIINLCEQRVEQEEGALARKARLEHSLDDVEIHTKRTREELKSIENGQSNWKREWCQAIDGLGLKPDVHPEHATETFDQLETFFEKYNLSEELRKRIYGMDQVEEDFNIRVIEFADRIGFNRDELEASSIAAQLTRDLNEAREARATLKKVDAHRKEREGEIEDADITIRTANELLASLRGQADVEVDGDLESAAESSRLMRKLKQDLERLEQELIRNGDGLSIEELENEAGESDFDTIEGELERISSELRELHENRDTLRDQRQTFQNEIDAKDGNDGAANASEQAQQHLASIVNGVEKYLRLQIAALILEQRIEEYRKKNQAPVLARAGDLFSRLTLGSYAYLRDELDASGKPILLGVRPNDAEVFVDGMSDGSRDQLYLALRLATLEQHLSKGEPIPFVVDDILVGFDDNRTKVCLEILAELSASTQVLLFTHHRRVIELAESIETKAGIFIHELA